jgi:mono/diheme cytochrome c family protein
MNAAKSTSLAIALAAAAVSSAIAACGGDDSGGSPADASAPTADAPPPAVDVSFADIGLAPAPLDAGWDAAACPGLTSPSSLDPAAVARGLSLVSALHCAGCHQNVPPAAIVLSGRTSSLVDGGDVYPPNLTPDLATGLGCWTDPQITNAILNGVDYQDASLCVMPLFAQRGVDAAAAEDIATFLRSLGAISNAVPATVCPSPDVDAGADATATDAAGE